MSGFSVCLIISDIWQGFAYASGIKYVRVLNMSSYSYNIIIFIVTNAEADLDGAQGARTPFFMATAYFFAITIKNYKLC